MNGGLQSQLEVWLGAGESVVVVIEGYGNACGPAVLGITEWTGTVGNTHDPDPPIVPCSYAVPAPPFNPTLIDAASGYHGLAVFGDKLVGSNGTSLVQATSPTVSG